jgi:wyosine [tRNA(Phe)-imidazoG37] synthetase (radical SAM superfamily)
MNQSLSIQKPQCNAVYGPVKSWRFGRSLGIDLIGIISTCTFNCVYCQLGNIQRQTTEQQTFIPTQQIISELENIADQKIPLDVVTFSGSGEPTLALNLKEIIIATKEIIKKPIVVLTNSTLLNNPSVRQSLSLADIVAVKLDAVSSNQLRQINRNFETIEITDIVKGIKQFRQEYQGSMAIQTMILSSWKAETQDSYINLIKNLQPDEIQLNIPSRPRALESQLESRGNEISESRGYTCQSLKLISTEELITIAEKIQSFTNIPVRYPIFGDW